MKKFFIILVSILAMIVTAVAIWAYIEVYSSKDLWKEDKSHKDIYVATGTSFKEWKSILKDSCPSMNSFWFDHLAEQMNLRANIHPGRYKIHKKMNLIELNKKFRSGRQDPVKVVLPVKWRPEKIAAITARQIEADSAEIMRGLMQLKNESFKGSINESFFLIPNTYEFYWNTNGEEFVQRMQRETKSFWDKNGRKSKAKKLGLTPEEVYTLASIVYRETSIEEEMPDIAGVYLNRLNNGIALQADPTIKYAIGDMGLRRILKSHLNVESPYNTYKYTGLPPGPISICSIQSIDAVLNANQHDYMYFCAKPDSSGRHAFAKTYNAHLNNAKKFHEWLNRRNIR